MMAQYRQCKNQLPTGTILLFRLGDFYEMFFDDAVAAAEALDMPAPMLAASIPNCNLTATTASKARAPLEAMFNLMQEGNPDILGGKLPDDGFYAL